jgi:hypothetical protein
MAKGDIHTAPHEKGWANKVEGTSRAASLHANKAEAQRRGREMAVQRKVEHLIHRANGTIGERNSYGGDPRRRPG